jgi:hypothetical protein
VCFLISLQPTVVEPNRRPSFLEGKIPKPLRERPWRHRFPLETRGRSDAHGHAVFCLIGLKPGVSREK